MESPGQVRLAKNLGGSVPPGVAPLLPVITTTAGWIYLAGLAQLKILGLRNLHVDLANGVTLEKIPTVDHNHWLTPLLRQRQGR